MGLTLENLQTKETTFFWSKIKNQTRWIRLKKKNRASQCLNGAWSGTKCHLG